MGGVNLQVGQFLTNEQTPKIIEFVFQEDLKILLLAEVTAKVKLSGLFNVRPRLQIQPSFEHTASRELHFRS